MMLFHYAAACRAVFATRVTLRRLYAIYAFAAAYVYLMLSPMVTTLLRHAIIAFAILCLPPRYIALITVCHHAAMLIRR